MINPDSNGTDLVQTAWAAALLIADSEDDAIRLVERLFSESEPTSEEEVLSRLERITDGRKSGALGVWSATIRDERLDDAVRDILDSMTATRRLEVMKAWLPDTHETEPVHSERTVFTYAVWRTLADNPGARPAVRPDDAEIRSSLMRVVGPAAMPVPASLRARIDTAMLGRTRDPAVVQKKRSSPAMRFGGALAVILLASLIGIWVGRPVESDGPAASAPPNLFEMFTESWERTVIYTGPSPSQAERVLLDQFGARIAVPELTGGRLEGASSMDLSGHVDIPVLHYETDEGRDLELYVVSYRLLDEFRFEIAVDPSTMAQLSASDGVDVTVDGDMARTSWRYRDDLYTVFTASDDPAAIRSRFVYR